MDKIIKCPECKKTTMFSDKNPYRPFCSERCQLIDLGEWAEGNYSIGVEPADPEEVEKQRKSENLDS